MSGTSPFQPATVCDLVAESSLNVSEVAAEFGYENVFLFSRQFRQVLRRSPSQYRRAPERVDRGLNGDS